MLVAQAWNIVLSNHSACNVTLLVLLGNSSDPSMCGCVEQQWLVLPCPGGDGAGPDDDPGHVEQGLLP